MNEMFLLFECYFQGPALEDVFSPRSSSGQSKQVNKPAM